MKSTGGQHTVPFLDLVHQYEEIRDEVDAAINSVVSTASFIGGETVKSFERDFASYLGVDECIGVANGTDAIEIALEALGLPPGGEVIVPAASFIASSEAVTRSGHSVVFADVSPDTYTLDPDDVRQRINERTVGILAVHLFGHPAPVDALLNLSKRHGLVLLEDAAQAHGAEIGGRRVGTLGTAGTFSFYPGKNLGAYGDGGAIVTQNGALSTKMRMLANHGRTSKYAHEFEGRNSRLDGLQAAVLSVKLRHLDEWTDRRRSLAARYREGLSGVGDLVLPVERDGCKHVYHLFVVRTGSRDALRTALTEQGVATGIHYPRALPQLSAYRGHPQHAEDFFAQRMAGEVLSLPMGDGISHPQVDRVIEAVCHFFRA
jgi:dTDP-4-amino-4,6-dideoxygalactose transaminase